MSKLSEMIKHHEGVVPHAYQDSRGYWTIGVGRLIDESLGGGLSDAEIDYLLANDIKRCRAEAEQYPWFNKMNEPRQAVILCPCCSTSVAQILTNFRTCRLRCL